MKLSALLLASVLVGSLFVSGTDAPRSEAASPVLVELFTSEGCSSCPPADTLLQQLDRTQPVSGAELIVLSEHVDYWNHIGWTDPFSSRFFSDRQSAYAGRFGLASVYTPQMVVDGAVEFVGGDSRLVSQAIQKSLPAPKIAIRISGLSLDASKTLNAHVDTDALPDSCQGAQSRCLSGCGTESCGVAGIARREWRPPSESRWSGAESDQNRQHRGRQDLLAGRSYEA